jgi:hypothetical protein
MGFEPTTPFGAPDFESGRWPVRLPSSKVENYGVVTTFEYLNAPESCNQHREYREAVQDG